MWDIFYYYMISMVIISLLICVALPVVTKFPQCLFSPEIHLFNWLDENNITTAGKIIFFIVTLPIFGFVYVIYFIVISISFTLVLLIHLFFTLFSKKENE